mmetsp:Transcript_42103/g.124923  ORF Transcript_42103/g.124923 Transcript_42103/m.124923 type:complete len:260 (+) Transcript_42103:1483-2262(+)
MGKPASSEAWKTRTRPSTVPAYTRSLAWCGRTQVMLPLTPRCTSSGVGHVLCSPAFFLRPGGEAESRPPSAGMPSPPAAAPAEWSPLLPWRLSLWLDAGLAAASPPSAPSPPGPAPGFRRVSSISADLPGYIVSGKPLRSLMKWMAPFEVPMTAQDRSSATEYALMASLSGVRKIALESPGEARECKRTSISVAERRAPRASDMPHQTGGDLFSCVCLSSCLPVTFTCCSLLRALPIMAAARSLPSRKFRRLPAMQIMP